MISRLLFALVVPVLATAAALLAMAALLRDPRGAILRVSPKAFRFLLRLWSLAIGAYFIVLAVGPMKVWVWFSTPVEIPHRDLALGIAGIAITAWTGCLIAFAVKQRLTSTLSRGLRFMIYACFTPIVALTGSGIALRGFALAVAILAALWTAIQFRQGKRSLKMDFNAQPVQEDGSPPPTEASQRQATYLVYFLRDRFEEVLYGWPWSATLCVLAVGVLLNATESMIVGCSLVALLAGVTLAFYALVVPEVGDSSLIV